MKTTRIDAAVGLAALLSLVGFAWLDQKAALDLPKSETDGGSFLSMLAAWNKPMLALPAGTKLSIQLEQTIPAEGITAGQTFAAVLLEPLVVGQYTLAPAGSRVQGLLTEVTMESINSTGMPQKSRLKMVVRKLFVDDREYILTTLPLLSETVLPKTGYFQTASNELSEKGMDTRFIFTLSYPLELPVYRQEG